MNFSHSTYSINEDSGPLQPLLVLSNPSSTNITVEVFNTNITALGMYCGIFDELLQVYYVTGGGVDYESGPYTVVIPAGETRFPFAVPITDDDVLEGNENFNLTINASSLPNCVIVTNPYQATVTIVDNDGKIYLVSAHSMPTVVIYRTKICQEYSYTKKKRTILVQTNYNLTYTIRYGST